MNNIHRFTTTKFFFSILIAGFLFVFYGNFFGIDLSDEGLAVLGFTPHQEIGITFTHYQILIMKLFPHGLDFILARQIRWILIILSAVILLFSVYKSKLRAQFTYFVLFIGATTLISLSTGIRVLSYNGLNQFIVTLYVASLIQYINAFQNEQVLFSENKKNNLVIGWLILISIFVGFIYIIRLPSFFPYILLQGIIIIFITRKQKTILLFHIFVYLFFLLLTVLFLSKTVVSFDRVLSDVKLFAQMSSAQEGGHGFQLVARYVIEFVQKLIIIFFTSLATLTLQRSFSKIKGKLTSFTLKALLVIGIIFVLLSSPLSISTFVIFSSFFLTMTYYTTKSKQFNLSDEWQKIFLAGIFPAIAVASALGSNVWIINLLLFYLSIWSIAILFFLSGKTTLLFKRMSYFMVILAILKVLLTGFIMPHRQGSLFSEFKKFQTETRGSVLLDSEMYNYVNEIKNYLKSKSLYGRDIIAISRLPGLVYLLDSNIPGSINFTDAYWQIFCANLDTDIQQLPVVIFRGNIPKELINCLPDHGIELSKNYHLDRVVNQGFSIYRMPTYIYIPDKSVTPLL